MSAQLATPTAATVSPTSAPAQPWRTHMFSETGLIVQLPPRYEGGRWEAQTYQFKVKAQNHNNEQGDVIHIFVDKESSNLEDRLKSFLSGPIASQAITGTLQVSKPVGWQGYIITYQLPPDSPGAGPRGRFAEVLKAQDRALLEIGISGDTLVQADMNLSPEAERIVTSAQVLTSTLK